jgi:hypothetical protein
MIEVQSDGEVEAFRILETHGNQATLKYIAMDESAAVDLVAALDWLDTFRTGVIAAPPKPAAPRRGRPKKETLLLQLELEDPPSPAPRRRKK